MDTQREREDYDCSTVVNADRQSDMEKEGQNIPVLKFNYFLQESDSRKKRILEMKVSSS